MIAIVGAAIVAVALALCLTRLFVGPTLYDRILGANAVVQKGALISAALAVAAGRSDWLDVALAMVLGAFVFNIAVLKFFRVRSFQAPLARGEG